MTAKMAPIAENTAKMGNNAPVCGAMPTDWEQLNLAYCVNPAKMTPAVQYAIGDKKCFSSTSSCNAAAAQIAEPSCPSGFSTKDKSSLGCFTCSGSECFNDQPGDNWVATAYRAQITSAGTYRSCGAPIFGMKAVVCTSNAQICGDSDATYCGYGPLQGQSCKDATFAQKCPKTCGTGPCKSGPTPATTTGSATTGATTTQGPGPSTCSDSCTSNADCCTGKACNKAIGNTDGFSMCFPKCSGSASGCSSDSTLLSICNALNTQMCCHTSGVCSCMMNNSCLGRSRVVEMGKLFGAH